MNDEETTLTLTLTLVRPAPGKSYGETMSDILADVARKVRTKTGGGDPNGKMHDVRVDGVRVGLWWVR